MHKVVRPFPVSWDGLTLIDLHPGDERDFGDMAAGLQAEGYIVAIEGREPSAESEQPAKRPYKKRK